MARSNAPAPLTFSDLTADLIWPMLLRAGHVALRPSRLGMAMVYILGLMLLVGLGNQLSGKPEENVLGVSARLMRPNPGTLLLDDSDATRSERFARGVYSITVTQPAKLLREYPWTTLIAVPLLAVWTALAAGAIARSAACDVAQGVAIEWPRAVGFAVTRWRSLALALTAPLLIAWGLMLGMACAGCVLFSWSGINVLGGLLWPVFLFGGIVVAVVLLAFAAGWPLLAPSVACEGTDAVDAVQHAYSFVFARPLRLAFYLLILAVQMVLVGGIVATICWLGVHIAQRCGMVWSGWRGEQILSDLPNHPGNAPPKDAAGGVGASHALVTFWTLVPALGIPASFAVSYIWSASTVLYLAMRKLVDGQDIREIWMPGMVEGTLAASLPTPASSPATSEAVSDTGPADAT